MTESKIGKGPWGGLPPQRSVGAVRYEAHFVEKAVAAVCSKCACVIKAQNGRVQMEKTFRNKPICSEKCHDWYFRPHPEC